jgi:drug/metabolite transporter superfamily protein YnfA
VALLTGNVLPEKGQEPMIHNLVAFTAAAILEILGCFTCRSATVPPTGASSTKGTVAAIMTAATMVAEPVTSNT